MSTAKLSKLSVRDFVEVKEYPKETKVFVGVKTDLAALTKEEVEIFVRELDRMIAEEMSPAVRRIVLVHSPMLRDLVRRVKTEVKQPFRGAYARGSQLTMIYGRPRDFTKAGVTMGTWLFDATAGLDWFISGSGDAAIKIPEEEGLAFLGWCDPVDTPCVEAIQLEKGGDLMMLQTLNFEVTEKYPVHELLEPWVIQPEQSYRIQVRYFRAGPDRLQPISFRVAKAETLITAL